MSCDKCQKNKKSTPVESAGGCLVDLQKVVKTGCTEERKVVYPKTIIEQVYCGGSGKGLKSILLDVNHIHLRYTNNFEDTVSTVPMPQRRKGLVVSFVDRKGKTITKRSTVDCAGEGVWTNPDNWENYPAVKDFVDIESIKERLLELEENPIEPGLNLDYPEEQTRLYKKLLGMGTDYPNKSINPYGTKADITQFRDLPISSMSRMYNGTDKGDLCWYNAENPIATMDECNPTIHCKWGKLNSLTYLRMIQGGGVDNLEGWNLKKWNPKETDIVFLLPTIPDNLEAEGISASLYIGINEWRGPRFWRSVSIEREDGKVLYKGGPKKLYFEYHHQVYYKCTYSLATWKIEAVATAGYEGTLDPFKSDKFFGEKKDCGYIPGGLNYYDYNAIKVNPMFPLKSRVGFYEDDASSIIYQNTLSSNVNISLDKILSLNITKYHINPVTKSAKNNIFGFSEDGYTKIGTSATQLEKVLPELVAYDAYGRDKSIDYSKIGLLAISGLKKIKKLFDTFSTSTNNKLSDLEKTVKSLQKEVNTLKSKKDKYVVSITPNTDNTQATVKMSDESTFNFVLGKKKIVSIVGDPKKRWVAIDEILTEIIPFSTKYEDNPTLEVGVTKIKSPGSNGSKKYNQEQEITYVTYSDGSEKIISRGAKRKVGNAFNIIPAKDKVVYRGTKPTKVEYLYIGGVSHTTEVSANSFSEIIGSDKTYRIPISASEYKTQLEYGSTPFYGKLVVIIPNSKQLKAIIVGDAFTMDSSGFDAINTNGNTMYIQKDFSKMNDAKVEIKLK